jgi:replication factor C subunit 3/5
MFFVDRYAPKTPDDVFFHKDIIDRLATMSKDNAVPNIIFDGRCGSGKRTLVRLFLSMLYGKDSKKRCSRIYNVKGSGNTITKVNIMQSCYHIEINPYNTNFDRYLVHDVIKEYAIKIPLSVFTATKDFKVVLINNIDNLTYYAQTSLRRTMEKYANTCRFIMWTTSLSKVIDPLKSRCFCFRVPAPSDGAMFDHIYRISIKEKMKLDFYEYMNLIRDADGDIRKSLWLLESKKWGLTTKTSYDIQLRNIIDAIMKVSLRRIPILRDLIYTLTITNFTGSHILRDIVDGLMDEKISDKTKLKIIKNASKMEHRLMRGRREITQLEGFITSILYFLYLEKKKKKE